MTPFVVLALASAAPLEIPRQSYPWQASFEVPPERAGEVLRIPVPVALRSTLDPADASDLAVVGPDGVARPFTLARGEGSEERVSLELRPEATTGVWTVAVPNRPVDGLEVALDGGDWVARVTVEVEDGGRWVPVTGPAIVWQDGMGGSRRIDLPRTKGRLRLTVEPLHGTKSGLSGVVALHRALPHVAPVLIDLDVAETVLEEDGWARSTVDLGRAMPVAAVHLRPDEPVFDRQVEVRQLAEIDPYQYHSGDARVRRVHLGGATLDQTRVPLSTQMGGDLLAVWVQTAGQAVLDLPQVTVELVGTEILVPEGAPGTWTILAGAMPGTTPQGDLAVALPELARLAGAPLTVGAVGPNPAYVPTEVHSGLAQPASAIELRGQRWAHPVEGPKGLVRIPLPLEVLADAQPDWRDLRLIDREDRQIPHFVRRRPVDTRSGGLEFVREEQGQRSLLRVPLPTAGEHADGAPVATVRLVTSATLFQRNVSVLRARGAVLEPVRVVNWVGTERPRTLALEVGEPVGRELVLAIDNGDDPPLPIDELSVTRASYEVVAWLPDGGARLVYGDRTRQAPSYDLVLARAEILGREMVEAVVGPRVALEAPPLPPVERGMVLAGLVALAVGLGVLVFGLVRAVPAREAETVG